MQNYESKAVKKNFPQIPPIYADFFYLGVAASPPCFSWFRYRFIVFVPRCFTSTTLRATTITNA